MEIAETMNTISFAYTRGFIFGTGMTRKKHVATQKRANPIMPPEFRDEPGPITFGSLAMLGKIACSITLLSC